MEKIDIDKIFKSKNATLYKWLPGFILKYIKRVVHQEDVNAFIEKNGHKTDIEFADAIIEGWHIDIKVKGIENLPIEGGCIVASNHPLGGLDGMALVSAIGKRRSDQKFLVNDLLMHLDNLSGIFVGINKHGKNTKEMLAAIDNLYASGQCILIFPAGLVSRKKGNSIRDLEWKKSFITKAKRYKLPVIPAHISGRNSEFFYRLANIRKRLRIKSNIEMFYLVDEMYQQTGRTITITFGKPIDSNTFNQQKNDAQWAEYVKDEVYMLA